MGPHVQGQHRRPARLARAGRRAAGSSRRAPWCGPTTRRPGRRRGALVPGLEVVADPYEAVRRRAAARPAHRVGRVPLARLRPGGRRHGGAARARRRPQPARPGGACAGAASPTRASGADAASGRHRRRRVPRLAPLRRCSARAAGTSSRSTTSSPADRENVAHLADDPGSPSSSTTSSTASPSTGAVDAVLHFASPASPPEYLAHPIETLKVGSLGTRNALDLARAQRRALPARVDQRDLRRPARAPAARELLGQREPVGPRVGVRRGEALRRGDHDGVPPRARRRHQIVRIFNTYGPRLGAGRRPGRVELPRAGDATASRSRSTATASRPARSASSTTRSRGLARAARVRPRRAR